MKFLRLFALAVPIILLAAWADASPQLSHYVYLSENVAGGEPCTRIIDSEPVVRQIHVLVSSPGAVATGFSAPLPGCVIGATYLSDTVVFPVTLGNSQTGVAIGFGACLSGNAIHVLTINCLFQGLTEECCSYQVLPYPHQTPPGVYVVDCQDNLVEAIEGNAFVSEDSLSPVVKDPSPPDRAALQPLETKLNCTVRRCDCTCCALLIDVYFGTNPDPPVVAYDTALPYDPGSLRPHTTYYWRVKAYGAGAAMSPVWSFATSGVPTQSTNWGAIKALYRE